jgi:transposase
VGWKDVGAPKPFPKEFREDVVRVARHREPGVTLEQIAADFGIHPMTLSNGCASPMLRTVSSPARSPA